MAGFLLRLKSICIKHSDLNTTTSDKAANTDIDDEELKGSRKKKIYKEKLILPHPILYNKAYCVYVFLTVSDKYQVSKGTK